MRAPPGVRFRFAVRKGIFRKDLSLRDFCRSFYLDNVEIKSNKESRWRRYLHAERNGVLLERPQVASLHVLRNHPPLTARHSPRVTHHCSSVPQVAPLWKPYKVYHEPMFGRLQSSYADVEHELNVMRSEHTNESVLFVAGDGLALMRMNHILASKADVYFEQTPFVIPVQGECPHLLLTFYTSITACARNSVFDSCLTHPIPHHVRYPR